jgi:hypothetical protein
MSKFTLRAATAALAGILIAIGGCAESPSAPAEQLQLLRTTLTPSYSRAGASASAVIGAEGGALQTEAGHKIVFPAGALSQPTRITMSTVPGYAGVDLQPHGLVFPATAQPVLTLNYEAAQTAGLHQFTVVYVDESGAIAEVLATRALGDSRLRSVLQHFSRYLVAGG